MILQPRDALELRLQQIWEDLLDRRPISVDANFFEIGGDSLSAMTLLARVVQETNYHLPPSGIMEAPTIEKMAQLLRKVNSGHHVWSPLVPLQLNGEGPPLYLVHPLGGNVLCYLQLVRHLGTGRPMYGLQCRGIDGMHEPWDRIEPMAEEYVEAIVKVQPQGPYLLAGWSLGGVIAYEMARQLRQSGQEVALLALLDSGILYAFAVMLTFFRRDSRDMWSRLASPEPEQVAFFRQYTAEAQLIPPQADEALARRIYRVVVSNMRALHHYHPQPYPGKVTLFQARQKYIQARHEPQDEWQRLAAAVEVVPTAGNHLTLVHEPHVVELAERLSQLLHNLPSSRQ